MKFTTSPIYYVTAYRVADDSLLEEKSFTEAEMDSYEDYVSGLEKNTECYVQVEVKRVYL